MAHWAGLVAHRYVDPPTQTYRVKLMATSNPNDAVARDKAGDANGAFAGNQLVVRCQGASVDVSNELHVFRRLRRQSVRQGAWRRAR